MKNGFAIYKPKIIKEPFYNAYNTREITDGIIIKSDNENYNKKDIAHAYINVNGEIRIFIDDSLTYNDNKYVIIKVLVINKREHRNEGLNYICSNTDFLRAAQLDAIAWLCREWCTKYYTDNIINQAGDMFPMDLLKKYISNDGFTKYE